jgi:hypothetical protein
VADPRACWINEVFALLKTIVLDAYVCISMASGDEAVLVGRSARLIDVAS